MEHAQVPGRVAAKVIVSALVAAAGAGHQLISARGEPTYVFVDALMERGLHASADRELRVHGFVKAGTIALDPRGDRAFVLEYRGFTLPVVAASGSDVLRDQAELIVTGRLVEDEGWHLAGTAMIARCGGKQIASDRSAVFE